MLKRLLEETPAPPPASRRAGQGRARRRAQGRRARHAATRPSRRSSARATRLNGAGLGEGHAPRRARHRRQRPRLRAGRQLRPLSRGTIRRSPRRCARALRVPPRFPVGGKPIRDALIEDYALGPAPDALFELIGLLVGGERRRKAKALAAGEDPDGDAATLDVLAVLEKFAPVHPDPEAFLECLEPLQPRLYSISSSPLATPGEVHLTVDAVRYDIAGRQRPGRRLDLPRRSARARRARQGLHPEGARLRPAQGRRDADHHGRPRHRRRAVPLVPAGIARRTKATGRAWLFFGHQREADRLLLSRRAATPCWPTAR